MFDKILIANRGEIALRVCARERNWALPPLRCTRPPMPMPCMSSSPTKVCIGPPPARESYLNIPALLAACEITGADAIHSGLWLSRRERAFRRNSRRTSNHVHRSEARTHPADGRQDRSQAHGAPPRHSLCARAPRRGDDDDEALRIADGLATR